MSEKSKSTIKNTCMWQNSYLVMFRFVGMLDVVDSAVLTYLIDLDDFKSSSRNNHWIEITPTYVNLLLPGWKISTVRRSLKRLVESGYIEKKPGTGRGNYYRLKYDAINNLISRYKEFENTRSSEYDNYLESNIVNSRDYQDLGEITSGGVF